MLLYSYDIVFQEVPNEITLALNISDCPYHCQGCHSPHLWGVQGERLSLDLLDSLIRKYKNRISCVCFMGGDKDRIALNAFAKYIKVKHRLKVAWYSGCDTTPAEINTIEPFNYVKFGHYDPVLGPLKSPTTNQRMYKKTSRGWVDITYKFHRRLNRI